MIIRTIEYSLYQPSRTDVAWAKPVKGGFALYLYFNGKWQPQVLMNSMSTDTPEDDEVADISGTPSYDDLDQKIQEEVTRQIADHDASVNDTHNTTSGDLNEYPDIDII